MEAKDQLKSKISWWCSGVQTFSTEGGTALCYPGYQDHSRDVKQLLVLIQLSTIEGHLPHCGQCHVQLRVVRDLDTRRTGRHGSQARQGGGLPLGAAAPLLPATSRRFAHLPLAEPPPPNSSPRRKNAGGWSPNPPFLPSGRPRGAVRNRGGAR